jgi:hypothetical protein
MTTTARTILRDHAEKLLQHLDDPRADLATLCDQAEQSAALARAELVGSDSVTTHDTEAAAR